MRIIGHHALGKLFVVTVGTPTIHKCSNPVVMFAKIPTLNLAKLQAHDCPTAEGYVFCAMSILASGMDYLYLSESRGFGRQGIKKTRKLVI